MATTFRDLEGQPTKTTRKLGLAIGAVVILVLGLFIAPIAVMNLWEVLDANEVMVIQSIGGTLTVHTEPGPKWQGWGKVTKYPRRAQYSFVTEGEKNDNSKKLRFNDGGHANLSGAVSWEMPLKPEAIIAIHRTFGNAEGVQQQAVAKMIDAAVYLAGPLMSSTESSGERRAELVQYINDQAENGVYVTRVVEKEVADPITGAKKTVQATQIVLDDKGNPRRQQGSILAEFNIKLFPLSITEIKYDSVVENQIKQRQEATTQVQIAQANAKRAEQDAITTAKQGEASAAKAKWEQETIKAKEVTLAQQKLEVATLAAKEAEQFKREQILRGEGEAERKRLVMAADGALDPKLEAFKTVNKYWADAFGSSTGQLVPSIVMGNQAGGNSSSVNNAQLFMDLIGMKAARDLSLDVTIPKGGNVGQKK